MKPCPSLPVALVAGLALVLPLAAQAYTFTKVADTTTAIPTGTGNFTNVGNNMVSVSAQGHVGFYGAGSGGQTGIYYWNGTATTQAADLSTAIPSGSGNFTGLSFFGNGMGGGKLLFRGNGNSSQSGLYLFNSTGSTLTKVADTGTAIPGGTGNFTSYTTGYIDGTSYGFIASGGSGQQGIYVSDGTTVTRIADKASTVPGIGGTYAWSSQLGYDSGNLVFWANITGGTNPGGIIGGYTPGGGLVTLATTGTLAPGAGTNFTSFTSPADLAGTTVAFRGQYTGGAGIFTTDLGGGAINRLADFTMAVPGGAGNFTSLSSPSISGNQVAFIGGFTGGDTGIYFYDGTALQKIIDTNDQLDGKTVTSFGLSENGFTGGYLAFRASFSDSSVGIYTAQISAIPEPSTYALLAGGLVLGLAAWRRRAGAGLRGSAYSALARMPLPWAR